MIEFKALHNLDLVNDSIVAKQILPDFAAFTNDYLTFARSNGTTKKYTVVDNTTQVINCLTQIIQLSIFADVEDDALRNQLAALSLSIANRLLRAEKDAQDRIVHMNKFIKKGSLIQAIVRDGVVPDSYLYIIAKVEHSEWFDGESL